MLSYQRHELRELITSVRGAIKDNWKDLDEDVPHIQLTVATNTLADFAAGHWVFQTGDNSYTGDCYGYRNWAVIEVYRDTDPREAARDILTQLAELCAA